MNTPSPTPPPTPGDQPTPGDHPAALAERHATNLELFLDLVFVFAVTQLTGYLATHLTPTGVAQSILLAWFAWWQWTAFTWAGSATDLQQQPSARRSVLMMIPAALVMAISLPYALTTAGPWFGISYFVVQGWVLVIQGVEAWPDPAVRSSFVRYAPLAMLAPAMMAVGGFLPERPRLWCWIAVALLFVGSAILGGREGGEWSVHPVHFAERHTLFVIISLGEVLVAIGANATSAQHPFAFPWLGGILAATAGACAYWWAYFAYLPDVLEHALKSASSTTRGRVARDLCSFGHVPIVFGIIAYAVVAKHVVAHPTHTLPTQDRTLLVSSAWLFIGGFMHIQWRLVRRVSTPRAAAVVCIGALGALGAPLPGAALVGLFAAVIAVTATLTQRNYAAAQLNPTDATPPGTD